MTFERIHLAANVARLDTTLAAIDKFAYEVAITMTSRRANRAWSSLMELLADPVETGMGRANG